MAFCTSCGAQMFDTAKFCPGCGRAQVPAAPAAAGYTVEPLDFSIEGDILQVARVRLKPGQELMAEAGKMLYKTPSVQWETRMSGQSIGEKLWGAVKRNLMGSLYFSRTSAPVRRAKLASLGVIRAGSSISSWHPARR